MPLAGHAHHFACIALADSIVEYTMYWELKRNGRKVKGHWNSIIKKSMEEFPQFADHESRLQRLHNLYRNPFVHGIIDAVSEANMRVEHDQSRIPTEIHRGELVIKRRDHEFRLPKLEVLIGSPGQPDEILKKEVALIGSADFVAEECFEIARQFLGEVARKIDHFGYRPLGA